MVTTDSSEAYLTPEAKARVQIDAQLEAAGWVVQNRDAFNPSAGRGVAVREFPLAPGHGFADYLLFVDGAAVGVLEAKKAGVALTGVEVQSAKYTSGLPSHVTAARAPLPFAYESTGVETRFTNGMDPAPRSRQLFHFHRPDTLAEWLHEATTVHPDEPTLRHRLRAMPPLDDSNLWWAQAQAIANLEESLAHDRPRAAIQMATGSGKTYTAANQAYRLIKHADARRVVFLVDRSNLGEQAEKEFQQFVIPGDGRKFTELYNVQLLTSNRIDPAARVVITTIQRLYSILRGDSEMDPELDEHSAGDVVPDDPVDVVYNPDLPIETFDFVIIDECHRSIYGLWRQVLDYFDAYLIGLTATPSKQTLGFFNRNLVMSYTHEQAVADRVNVDFEVYRIRTEITETGGRIAKGDFAYVRDRRTREEIWKRLDDDLEYDPNELDRRVIAEDQIRTVIREFRDKLFTDIFPGRSTVPKTLIFAKDDSHADDIVDIVREEFGQGNDFCQKITYRTTGKKPKEILAEFRNSVNPRIAVTVDMIATGTDVKPLECVFFMRSVKSRNFFEQMKGRGVRVIPDTDFQAVTPDARTKTHFVIVDAVGATETNKADTQPLERKRTVPLAKLLDQIAYGSRDPDIVSSLASRLARLDRQLTAVDRDDLRDTAGGTDVRDLVRDLLDAIDPDRHVAAAVAAGADPDAPDPDAVATARTTMIDAAVQPLVTNPQLRSKLIEVRHSYEQVRDVSSEDRVITSGFSRQAADQARALVTDWEQFVAEHRDDIAALQVLYSRPHRDRLTYRHIKELAAAIQRPPRRWTPEVLWEAYEALDQSRVHGSGRRMLTDLVSLVRFTLDQDDQLRPYGEIVAERFEGWLLQQQQSGRSFTDEQLRWLRLMRDVVASSLGIEPEDFEMAPLVEHGGLGRAYEVFGNDLNELIDELTQALTA